MPLAHPDFRGMMPVRTNAVDSVLSIVAGPYSEKLFLEIFTSCNFVFAILA